jgi:HEAT repeat protein
MAFQSNDWSAIVAGLRDSYNSKGVAAAAARLHQESTKEDLPLLRQLLEDPDAGLREAAAWPVSELVGPSALPELLAVYQRGLEEGLDCDGLTTALIDLAETNAVEAANILRNLADGPDPNMRENALWLLEFCEPKG